MSSDKQITIQVIEEDLGLIVRAVCMAKSLSGNFTEMEEARLRYLARYLNSLFIPENSVKPSITS